MFNKKWLLIMNYRVSILILSLILLFPSISVKSQTSTDFPTIDGFWSENEWPDSIISEYTFTDQVKVKFAYRVNDTHIFFMAQYKDETPTHNEFFQDAFAIGFDNNGDQSNMGTFNNPDDSVFIGFGNYSIDVYMQGIGKPIVKDIEVGGTNDTFGFYSLSEDNVYTYEFAKALNSGDSVGNDIKLKVGDSIFIMLAYWDNLSPFDEISGFTDWINLRISDPINSAFSLGDYLIPISLVTVITVILIFFRIKTAN
jgi:hypothetical protein